MQAGSPPKEETPEAAPATLGDVLYAGASPAPPSEQEWVVLVRLVATGDELALHALYERAYRVVFTLTMRLCGNRETAEEVTLDVFHALWRRAGAYDPRNGTVLGWIMNQARSRAIDRIRFDGRRKRTAPEAREADPAAPEAADGLELEERGRALRAALAVLTPAEREAIEIAYFSELTYAETAARLGQPLGTVKTRIRSALHKLRQALAAEAAS